jgi:serine/threonine protein kinase
MAAAVAEIPEYVGEYKIEQMMLGIGSNGCCVRLGVHLPTNEKVAVKILNISLSPSVRNRAFQESDALRQLHHENIIKLYGVYEEDPYFFLFLELAPGGDLFSFIQRHGRLDEHKARTFFHQIVNAIQHCHENGIVHHDLKLENLLLTEDENNLRLIDFGLCARITPAQSVISNYYAGSPLYMSPEIFSLQPHTVAIDIWSLGVCLYYMVTDTFPFLADTYNELEEKVLFDEVVFPNNMGLSDNLKDLVSRMLTKDPKQRITLAEIKKHSWWFESRYFTNTNFLYEN